MSPSEPQQMLDSSPSKGALHIKSGLQGRDLYSCPPCMLYSKLSNFWRPGGHRPLGRTSHTSWGWPSFHAGSPPLSHHVQPSSAPSHMCNPVPLLPAACKAWTAQTLPWPSLSPCCPVPRYGPGSRSPKREEEPTAPSPVAAGAMVGSSG